MPWNLFRICLRLRSPLHVGRSKTGNLQHTYPYVHGRALWGALTARLTRSFAGLSQPSAQDYETIGARVHQELAFSYLYPADKGSDNSFHSIFPWENPPRRRFLSSYASTALDPAAGAALEASLHEVEMICPHFLDGGDPLYLVGMMAERAGCALDWRGALNRLRLGGEQSYGWGRTALEEISPASDWFGLGVDLAQADGVHLKLGSGATLLAHTHLGVTARGSAAPFGGRQWRSHAAAGRPVGAGQQVSIQGAFWEPGSITLEACTVQVGGFGLWQEPAP